MLFVIYINDMDEIVGGLINTFANYMKIGWRQRQHRKLWKDTVVHWSAGKLGRVVADGI